MPSRSYLLPCNNASTSSSPIEVTAASSSQCRFDISEPVQQPWEVMEEVDDFDDDDQEGNSNSSSEASMQPPQNDLEDLVICE